MLKMASTIEGKPVWKWLLINALAIVFGGILFWSAYGLVAAFFVASPIGKNPEYEKVLREVLTQEQWKALKEGRISRREILEVLKRQDKDGKLQSMYWEHVKGVNWQVVNPSANAAVFGILGLTLGVMRIFKYIGLIPTILLWITYPLLTSALFSEVHYSQLNVLFSIFVQFVSIYLFSWLGMSLRQVLSRRGSQTTHASG